MKNQRKGFTLVELIVAMGIMAIVLGEIAMILGNSMKVYNNSAIEIHLQEEASQVVQMIENLMVDANASIDATNDPTTGSDIIVISDWEDKDAKTKKSYTIQLKNVDATKGFGTLWIKDPKGNEYPMADYVSKIKLKKDLYAVNSVVELQLNMKGDKYSYDVSKDIYNRNEIGTGIPDVDDVGGGSGEKSLSVLRYHTYDLSTMVPFDKEWVKAELVDSSKATEFANYYTLGAGPGFSLTPTDTLNGNNFRVPTSGAYDIKFTSKPDDAGKTETFVISVFSDKPEVAGGANQLLYTNAKKSDSATTFIPIKGLSVENVDKCTIDIMVGDKVLQTEEIAKDGGIAIASKDLADFHLQINQNEAKSLENQDVKTKGALVFRTADIGTVVFQTGMFNNAEKGNCKYGKFITDYNVLVYANVTLSWKDPSRTLSFKAFFYPVWVIDPGQSDKGSVFTSDQSKKFFELVNDGGGKNDSLEIKESEGGGEGANSGPHPELSLSCGSGASVEGVSYEETTYWNGSANVPIIKQKVQVTWDGDCNTAPDNKLGTVNVDFGKSVDYICYNPSFSGSGSSCSISPNSWQTTAEIILQWEP